MEQSLITELVAVYPATTIYILNLEAYLLKGIEVTT